MRVVGACEASAAIGMAAAGLRELGQAVSEVAEGGTACYCDETEGSDSDTCAGVKAVEQQNQYDHGCEGEAGEGNSKRHESSVDHAR